MLSHTLAPLSRNAVVASSSSSRSVLSRIAPVAYGRMRLYSTPATPAGLDEGEKAIYDKLSAKFPGNRLEVQDVSGQSNTLPMSQLWERRDCVTESMLIHLNRRMWIVLRYRNQFSGFQRSFNNKATQTGQLVSQRGYQDNTRAPSK